MLWRAERGGLDEAEVLPTLYWLAHVDDALAERETAHVAAALAEIPVDLGSQLWRRRAAGLPVGRPQARFAPRVLAHPECGSPAADAAPRCAALYAEILDLVLTDAALESGTPPPADPPEPPAIAELLTAVQASVSERRAVARGIAVAAAWVRAAPDPAARLRSLAARPPDGRWAAARVTWDGSGTPLLGALVLSVIGEQADVEVEVRNDAKGAWWFRIGGVDVTRTCGEVGAPPEGSPWPRAGLVAGALLERAQLLEETDVALRRHLAMAAQRIDPLVGGPLAAQLADTAPPDLAIGRRIGASLLGPLAVPSGADGGRRALGEGGPRLCPSRVN